MNYTWRITKYNPIYRDNNGSYIKEEWTSFNDIGKCFEGKIFTERDYTAIEELYVNSVLILQDASGVNTLRVDELEIYKPGIRIKNGMELNRDSINEVVKCILREKIWCKLECGNSFYVHFGYDFYMYIGSQEPSLDALREIIRNGLFVEDYQSPYLIVQK